jgi:hypothetical protein
MHCENTLCENILKTIFGTKDIVVVQEDLKDCEVQSHLWVQNVVVIYINPIASYALIDQEKERFLHIIHVLKMPTYYVCSLKKIVHKDGDLKGMKSHDFHVMMHNILSLCMWDLMSKGCRIAIICLCHVFKKLCAKILDPTTMGEFKKDVAMTLMLLE